MNRWTTVGEAFAYEKGYTEGRADVSKALEQSGCEDAVSRKAVAGIYTALWEIIGTIMDRDEWDDVCHTTANELPSVTPKQPGWIPVTERLPEEEGLYLVAGDFPPGAEVHTRYFNVLYDRSVWSGTMTDKVKWWMPIPKPPEGAQDAGET